MENYNDTIQLLKDIQNQNKLTRSQQAAIKHAIDIIEDHAEMIRICEEYNYEI